MKHGLRIGGYWLLLAVLVAVLAIVHWNWIFSLAPLQSADWPYFYASQLKEWFPVHFLWINYDGLGRGISQGNFTFLFSLYGLLAHFGANFEIISRLLFFLPVLMCAPLSSYLAVKEITGNKVAAVVGAFVYSLNTYFIVIQAGHMHISVAYALAPFVYYFAARKGRRSFFWFYVVLAIISVYDIRMALVIGFFGALLAFYHKVERRHEIWKFFRTLMIGAICLALFSAYWILPMRDSLSGPFTRNVFDQRALNWITSLDSFSIHHPFWSSEGVTDFIFEPAPFYMYALPILAFTPFALPRKSWDGMNRTLLFYGVVGIASIVLLMQENSLFAGLYKVIYDNLPLMSMFRESSKLFFITSFCYSVLIGFLIIELYKRKEKRYGLVVMSVAIFAIVAPITPYLTGHYVKTYKKEPIKPDITAVNTLVDKSGQVPTRTLWVSRMPEFARMSNTAPAIDAADFGSKYWNRYANPFAGHGITFLAEPNAPTLLNFAGIQHVVVPPDDADSNFHHYDKQSAQYYEKVVSSLNFKELPRIGGYRIWKNEKTKPYIYFSTDTILVDTISTYSGIDNSQTSAYLFEDQNSKRKEAMARAVNNYEYNIFQPKYSRVEPGKIVSQYKIEQNRDTKLYMLDQKASERSFSESVHTPGQGPVTLDEAIEGKNLYRNGSFESKEAVKVGDCNNTDESNLQSNGISAVRHSDAIEGAASLRVTAKKHIACFFSEIPRYDPKAYYMISFRYKYISGKGPYVALYPFAEEPIKRQTALSTEKKNEWQSFQTIIRPDQFSDNINLNLYVPTSEGKKSEVIFDNIKVYQVPHVPEAYIRTVDQPITPKTIKIVESSPVKHVLRVDDLTQARLLVFSETFDPNWKLSLHSGDEAKYYVPSANHLQTNGFANGWWLDPSLIPAAIKNKQGAYTVALEYEPQKSAYKGAAITGAVIVGAAIYLVVDLVRVHNQRRHRTRR